ncbi:hypothetical protein P691DRAFT_780725 [Macrolepiota fuliginosa MF-IS2]|uniref:Uncharacterized protein n=1 Tax=Macrolepiota fuliginosa MF-IS2 TaxID=1400762 RepID=A0A9P5X006_9AGAR|nr:hypothetical protein P691DRAFT_780725 [Macrolepiota fuliginosa MF-IS2]
MDVLGWRTVDFWESVSKCRPQSFKYKLLGQTAPLSSLTPNITGSSSLAPGSSFIAIEQEAPPLYEMVEPDNHSLDNEPVDIDAPESTSMMVNTLPYGEVETPPPPMPKLDWVDNQPLST